MTDVGFAGPHVAAPVDAVFEDGRGSHRRTRARQLAREAVDGFEALKSEEVAEVERWLDAHAGG